MSDSGVLVTIQRHLSGGGHLTLFLDYDGTLVPIAPTPAEAVPDVDLLELLRSLVEMPSLRTIILSGRPADELQRMLPVPGLILGALYGVEVQMGEQRILREPDHGGDLKQLTRIRSEWQSLISELSGFLLEDKGRAVALHARWANEQQATETLAAARAMAAASLDPHAFRLLDGDRYIEVAPATANKGDFVDWFLSRFPVASDLPIAFGDDNKDEAAFAAVQGRGGLAIGVGHRYALPDVDERVESPQVVRQWLRSLLTP